MKTKLPKTCPTCGSYLSPHCGNMACNWIKCDRCKVYGDGKRWARA